MKKFFYLLLFPLLSFGQNSYEDIPRLFEQKKYKEAERIAKAYVKEHPNDIMAIEFMGDAYGYQELWDDAIVYYKMLVDKNPSVANYHYKYGGALGMKALAVSKLKALGLIGDIKDAFLTAAQLDPKHIDTRWALVELYMQLPGIVGGSKKKALFYAQELQDLSLVDGYLAKGYIYEYDEEPQKAEMYYKQAIDVGGSLTCFQKLTNLYEQTDQPEKAIANIEAAQENHNRNTLHYQIGKVCADYNVMLDKGERCLKTFIQNHTAKDGVPIEWAYFRLAQIYKNRINKPEALKWINKAIATRANFEQALEEKAKILQL